MRISRKRLALLWFLFILIFTIIPLLLIEIGGRVYISYQYGVNGKSYGLWRYDEVLGAQHNENSYNTKAETNDHGFRNKENILQNRPEGALRIIAYGGSTTFCYNLENEQAWPLQLQKILRSKHNLSDQVLNGGAISWSIGHAFARAKKDIPLLKPDYVIIYSGINEETNATSLAIQGIVLSDLVENEIYGKFATNLDQNRWLKRNLLIVRALDYIIKPWIASLNHSERRPENPPGGMDGQTDPAILENYTQVLRRFILLAKKHGAVPVFVSQASGKMPGSYSYRATRYSKIGADMVKDMGVLVVDSQKMVSSYPGAPMDLFASSGVHYSIAGARILANEIYEKVFSDQVLR